MRIRIASGRNWPQQGLNPVEWGGETEMVQVSAKKRENLETLLETILLTSDILNLRASPTRLASGVVLEAKLDRGRGAVATVLVQQGTLRVHDPFIVGQIFGKVRAMFNDRGRSRSPKPGRRLRSKCSDCRACRRPARASRLSPTSRARSKSPVTGRC